MCYSFTETFTNLRRTSLHGGYHDAERLSVRVILDANGVRLNLFHSLKA